MLPADTALVLATVDGVRAKDASFRMRFVTDENYVAAYDCGEHSGSFRLGARLVLTPGAATGQTCDRADVSTGRAFAFDRRYVGRFFADPVFRVRTSGSGLVLTNRRHVFRFDRER